MQTKLRSKKIFISKNERSFKCQKQEAGGIFDLFQKGLPIYTFSNRCHELADLELGDDTQKVFLNPYCNRENVSADLTAFFDYLLGEFSDNRFVSELDNAVSDARQHREWRHEYMTLEMKMQEQYLMGKEETLTQLVCKKMLKGKDIPEIADALETDEEMIARIYEVALKQMPNFDVNAIYEELHSPIVKNI